MGRNPEIGGRGQPFQNRTESARNTIESIKAGSKKVLDRLLPQGPRLATDTANPTVGKVETPLGPKQINIQRIQIEERPKIGVKTQPKPAETFEEARRRRLQEEQEIAGGPTQEEAADANAGRLKNNPVLRFIQRNPALAATIGVSSAIVTAGAVASGINSMFDNRTEAHQSIDNSEESFKVTKLNDVITDNNVVDVSLGNIQSLPQFDRDGRPVILIATPPQGKTSSVERRANFADIGNERIDNFDTEGLFNIIEVELHANEPIPMPIDGYVFPTWVDREGGKRLASVEVLFELPNGRIGKISIYTPDIRDELSEAIKNMQIPTITKDTYLNNNWKQGLKLERGVPVSTMPVETNYPVEYWLQEIDPVTGAHYPSSISALTKDNKFPRIK